MKNTLRNSVAFAKVLLIIFNLMGLFLFGFNSVRASSISHSKMTINGSEANYLTGGDNIVRIYFNNTDLVSNILAGTTPGYGFDPQGSLFGYSYNDQTNESESSFTVSPNPTNVETRADFKDAEDGSKYIEFTIHLPKSLADQSGINEHHFPAKNIDGMGELIIYGIQTNSGIVDFKILIYAYTRGIVSETTNRRILSGALWSPQVGYCQLDHGVTGYEASISYKSNNRGNLYGHIYCPNSGWVYFEHPTLKDSYGNPISLAFIDPVNANDVREDGKVTGLNDPITVTEVLEIHDKLYGEAFSPTMGFIRFQSGYSTVEAQSVTNGASKGAVLASSYHEENNSSLFGWLFFDHEVQGHIPDSFDITSPKIKDTIQIAYGDLNGTVTKNLDNGIIEVSRNCAFVDHDLLSKYPECDTDMDGFADGANLNLWLETTYPEQDGDIEISLLQGSLGCSNPIGCPLLEETNNEVTLWNDLDTNNDGFEDTNPEQASLVQVAAIDNNEEGGAIHVSEFIVTNHRPKIWLSKDTYISTNFDTVFEGAKQDGTPGSSLNNVLIVQNQAVPTKNTITLKHFDKTEHPILGLYSNTFPIPVNHSQNIVFQYQPMNEYRYLQGELFFDYKSDDYLYFKTIDNSNVPVNSVTVRTDYLAFLEYFDTGSSEWVSLAFNEIEEGIWITDSLNETLISNIRLKTNGNPVDSVMVTLPGDTSIIGLPFFQFRDAIGNILDVDGHIIVNPSNSTISHQCETQTCYDNLSLSSSVEILIPDTWENFNATKLSNPQLVENEQSIPWPSTFPLQSFGLLVQVENVLIDGWGINDSLANHIYPQANTGEVTSDVSNFSFDFTMGSYYKNGDFYNKRIFEAINNINNFVLNYDTSSNTLNWNFMSETGLKDSLGRTLTDVKIRPSSSVRIEYKSQVKK